MINITYIYLVENIDNNPHKVYIGKTKKPRVRELSHRRKFGLDITYNIIDQIESTDKRIWAPIETIWIQTFKNWGFHVVNKNKGGGGVSIHSDETLQKLRKPKPPGFRVGIKHNNHSKMPEWYGEFISKINKGRVSPNKGKTKSPEAKLAISLKLKGRVSPNKKK